MNAVVVPVVEAQPVSPVPLVTVLMAVYNAERFLARAMDSLLAQTFSNFELIAVDDRSIDRSVAILRQYALQDPRVRVIERTNFRLLADDAFPEGFDLIVIDASFISLRTIVARAVAFLRAGGTMIALVKPQFEAGRERIGSGGVVRDPAVHAAILREVRAALEALGVHAIDACISPLRGPAGNVEFFYRIAREGTSVDDARIDALVAEAGAL